MLAIDQYGQKFYILGKHPRAELLEALGRKKASKMYRDKKDGRVVHCGYVIGGHWLTLYAPVETVVNR